MNPFLTIHLHLIAHKVCGEPSFDIAHQLTCPECSGDGCTECDDEGRWWIISTSGHRAFPFWHKQITLADIPPMPDDLPDHYLTSAAPSRPALADLIRTPPRPPTYRR